MTETTLQHALAEAQRITHTIVAELADDARTLRTRAEVELLGMMGEARDTGRERVARLGTELVKLGHKLERYAGTARKLPRRPARRERAHVERV